MPGIKKLPLSFYNRAEVALVARELLGKVLTTRFEGKLTAGRIVETEAYEGETDKASHAYGGRRTARTEVLFGRPGTAYVYLCYGIHNLFNVVTNTAGTPHAVLIRALEPVSGIDIMLQRTGKLKWDHSLTRGPGNLCVAMGITREHTGKSLLSKDLYIADQGGLPDSAVILTSPRIGVDYAAEHAMLPYRYLVKDNPFVSGKKPG